MILGILTLAKATMLSSVMKGLNSGRNCNDYTWTLIDCLGFDQISEEFSVKNRRRSESVPPSAPASDCRSSELVCARAFFRRPALKKLAPLHLPGWPEAERKWKLTVWAGVFKRQIWCHPSSNDVILNGPFGAFADCVDLLKNFCKWKSLEHEGAFALLSGLFGLDLDCLGGRRLLRPCSKMLPGTGLILHRERPCFKRRLRQDLLLRRRLPRNRRLLQRLQTNLFS